jgi:hypothetical protein
MTNVTIFITEMTVSVLPKDHELADTYALRVVWRGGDRYAVTDGFRRVLDRDGDWVYEPLPSARTDEFRARTRFDYHDALARATRAVPHQRYNGMTATDILAKEATEHDC